MIVVQMRGEEKIRLLDRYLQVKLTSAQKRVRLRLEL